MAGKCKPSIAGLGREASYTVLSMSSSQGSGGTIDNCGLFNGTNPNEWNTANVFYWGEVANFLEIEIKQDCNIWRCGTSSWANSNGKLNIFLYNDTTSSYDNITNTVEQTTKNIDNNNWEKTIIGLKKGRYKFTISSGLRLDSEWYIENISPIIWDSNTKGTNVTINKDELTLDSSSDNGVKANLGVTSGKYYMEYTIKEVGGLLIGVCNETSSMTSYTLSDMSQVLFYYNGNIFPNNVGCGLGALNVDSVLQVKLDADEKTIKFGLNNTWSPNKFALSGKIFYPVVRNYNPSNRGVVTANLGSSTFKYDVPSGYIGYNRGEPKTPMIWDKTTASSGGVVNDVNPLQVSVTGSTYNAVKTNISLGSGKYYMEFTFTQMGGGFIGICNDVFNTKGGDSYGSTNQVSLYSYGSVYPSQKPSGCGTGVNVNEVIGIKVNTVNKTISFAVNNVWGTEFALPNGTEYYPLAMNGSSGSTSTIIANFGNSPFVYTAPDGYTSADSGEPAITYGLLLKANDKYYSIKEECYDSTTKTFTEITDITNDSFSTYGFAIEDLITEITINSETFKPIDKFEQFSIVSLEDKTLNLSGIKSTKELIIGKESFVSKIADNIDFFKLNDEASANIKIVFSIDKGLTWKTYDFGQLIFKDIPDVIIPNKNYSEFTQTDIQNWNDSTNKISEVGIPANLLNTINFNVLKAENFKFGYVLSASSATGIDKMKQLIWRFDSKGIMQKCSDNEIIQQIYYGGVKIIPKINTDILKINITYEGIGGGTASDLVINKTDDDIQNDINEVWKINSSK